MIPTSYHARYYAYELTRRHPSDSQERLTAVLQDAQVDLNPHQVDAAHFAIKSPLSKNVLLADEVGLGKTIEAGIILSQKWAEGCRKLVVICPANLRKQWAQELQEKFFLPSVILENPALKGISHEQVRREFRQNKIVICSFQFAQSREQEMKDAGWDMAVIDEAHRLRNVYRPDNKIANSIKRSLANVRKVLLTATPLQNSISELYGLVSLRDDYVLGDFDSFCLQYSRLSDQATFDSLKERLSSVCQRTLRRQVQEYINYTKRVAMVVEFYPYEEEMDLYYGMNDYLSRPKLYALPSGQRHLMSLILRKLLSSSSFALQGTFERLADRLEAILHKESNPYQSAQEVISENFESYAEMQEEWNPDIANNDTEYSSEDIEFIRNEIDELRKFASLADSIQANSKGDKLITALEAGFERMRELGAPEKAIIFTESTRTQRYIYKLLAVSGYGEKTVLFNGSNNDPRSKDIYRKWLERHKGSDRISGSKTADMRQAITDYFREEALIMVATEAAAEGVNLQFCSLVVNYDMPWNPQRVEQRIGRCHRYGQKYDVVVINFLNKENAADQRVYRLLDEKFQLFNGVFGASDEILGAIEDGVDLEKKIGEIYQNCRIREEIEQAFDELQSLYEPEINKTMSLTRRKLLENFDAEVHEKLRVNLNKGREYLNKYEQWLWKMTRHYVGNKGAFNDKDYTFRIFNNMFGLPPGYYSLIRHGVDVESTKMQSRPELGLTINVTEHHNGDFNIYRLGHPLAQKIIEYYKTKELTPKEIVFNYSKDRRKISALEPYIGKSGFLPLTQLTINSYEAEDHLVLSGITHDGVPMDHETCHRLFDLDATESNQALRIMPETMDDLAVASRIAKQNIIDNNLERNTRYFKEENEKLNKWAEDRIYAAEQELKDIKKSIREKTRLTKTTSDPHQLLAIQQELNDLTKKQRRIRAEIFSIEDEIERQRDEMIAKIEAQLQQEIMEQIVFTIRWKLV